MEVCDTPMGMLVAAEEVGKEVGLGVAADSGWSSLSHRDVADAMVGMETTRCSTRCATSVALHRPRSSVHSPVIPSATCCATTPSQTLAAYAILRRSAEVA